MPADLHQGQVWESQYGVRYQILATWHGWAWVLRYGVTESPLARDPESRNAEFFDLPNMTLIINPPTKETA